MPETEFNRGELDMAKDELNPQPLPPRRIDFGDLTETITASVRAALEQRPATSATPDVFVRPRFIIGIIFEPTAVPPRIE